MIAKIVGIVFVVALIAASVGFNLYVLYQQQVQGLYNAGANAAITQMVEALDKGQGITLKAGDKEVIAVKRPESAPAKIESVEVEKNPEQK